MVPELVEGNKKNHYHFSSHHLARSAGDARKNGSDDFLPFDKLRDRVIETAKKIKVHT